MRSSSSLFAPSAIAILSMSLLCSLSGTAVSQTATGSAAPLPSITVDAPKQVARPIVRWQRHKGPVGWHTEQAGHRDPLKRRLGRRRLRGVLSWRSLPGSRERPAVATMVANQASNAARTPGLDAANRRGITQFSRQRAKTHSPTGTTRNAWKPKCSWAGTDNDPGGIAPACWLGGNFGSPHKIETGSALESRLNSGQLNHVSFVFGQPDRNVVAANTISIQGSIPPDQSST